MRFCARGVALPLTRLKDGGVQTLPTKFRRRWKWVLAALLVAGLALGWKAWADTMADPLVRTARVELRGLPQGTPAIRIALLSDIHVAGPDMPPSRLARIVSQVNDLRPDLVLIAGDLVSEKRYATHIYTAEEIVAPLGNLRAPMGTIVVPGNHDHWFDWLALRRQLQRNGITVLQNEATQRGPLAIGGVDDAYTRRDDLSEVLRQLGTLDGGKLIVTHSPDIAPQVTSNVPLVLAGHTHCGQIRLPVVGTLATMSRYGDRFACGTIEEGGQTVIVGAGLGTSLVPIRFGTRAEIWMVEVVAP